MWVPAIFLEGNVNVNECLPCMETYLLARSRYYGINVVITFQLRPRRTTRGSWYLNREGKLWSNCCSLPSASLKSVRRQVHYQGDMPCTYKARADLQELWRKAVSLSNTKTDFVKPECSSAVENVPSVHQLAMYIVLDLNKKESPKGFAFTKIRDSQCLKIIYNILSFPRIHHQFMLQELQNLCSSNLFLSLEFGIYSFHGIYSFCFPGLSPLFRPPFAASTIFLWWPDQSQSVAFAYRIEHFASWKHVSFHTIWCVIFLLQKYWSSNCFIKLSTFFVF